MHVRTALIFPLLCTVTHAADFAVEGICLQEQYVPQRALPGIAKSEVITVWETNIARFRVEVTGCKWRIRFEQRNDVYDYCEAAFDETQIHCVFSIKGNQRERKERGESVGQNEAIAAVHYGPGFCSSEKPPLAMLWLAYGSECYFSTNSPGAMRPLFLVPDVAGYLHFPEFVVRAEWALLPDYRLPKRAVLFSPDYLSIPDTISLPPRFRRPLDPPFDKPHTNLVFEVLQTTNTGHQVLPLEFQLQEFGLKRIESRLALIKKNVFRFSVTNLSLAKHTIAAPPLPGRTLVADYRFGARNATPPSIHYLANKNWLTKEDVKQTEDYQNLLKAKRVRSQVVPKSTKISVAVFIFGVAGVLGAISFWKTRTTKKGMRYV